MILSRRISTLGKAVLLQDVFSKKLTQLALMKEATAYWCRSELTSHTNHSSQAVQKLLTNQTCRSYVCHRTARASLFSRAMLMGHPLRNPISRLRQNPCVHWLTDRSCCKTLVLSPDPYMRGRMTGLSNFYIPQLPLGEVITGSALHGHREQEPRI